MLKNPHPLFFLFALIIATTAKANEPDPILTISNGEDTITYKTSELLDRDDLERVRIKKVPAYEYNAEAIDNMTFDAIKATTLFEPIEIQEDSVILDWL